MPYSELIKRLDTVRAYMRDFYIYGFKCRGDYDRMSGRTYDNERRRIESYFGDYIGSRRDASGKRLFLSIDSAVTGRNPLFRVLRAKSFTDTDITLHFLLADLLSKGPMTLPGLRDGIGRALSSFDGDLPDDSTVRKKLREYVSLGIIGIEKEGKTVRYFALPDTFRADEWKNALSFYSETAPLGFLGETLLDRAQTRPDLFRFKHHYIQSALDSEILLTVFSAIREKKTLHLTVRSRNSESPVPVECTPLRLYASVQSGRQYLLAFRDGRPQPFRLDFILSAGIGEADDRFGEELSILDERARHVWGVSFPGERRRTPSKVEMVVFVGKGEDYIVNRLRRERRCGEVEMLDESHYRFTAEVYDPSEMLPWIRTFIGRIVSFDCSDRSVRTDFLRCLKETAAAYEKEDRA